MHNAFLQQQKKIQDNFKGVGLKKSAGDIIAITISIIFIGDLIH